VPDQHSNVDSHLVISVATFDNDDLIQLCPSFSINRRIRGYSWIITATHSIMLFSVSEIVSFTSCSAIGSRNIVVILFVAVSTTRSIYQRFTTVSPSTETLSLKAGFPKKM
jgi:hypothetical protein